MKKASKTKKSFERKEIAFPFHHCSNKVSLSYFQAWCNRHIPAGAKDACIELKSQLNGDWRDSDSTYDQVLVVSWKSEIKK
jgi:hypothetical protein